ncbi:MAG: hypothetical protein M3R17_21210, partial [Bacteroidota bacterium]|nr:hypothetical protein [Bacteroidota bacterium]
FAALAALTMFAASCGNGEAEKKRKEDSANLADSLTAVHTKWVSDSMRMADSAARVEMKAKMTADSIHDADSAAAANKGKGGSKPKTPTVPKGEPNVGGKR